MSSLYEGFCEGSLPENSQKDCEGFASVSDSVEEKYFRAGFHCGLHIEGIFTDKDRPSMGRDFILVRKKDINLEWYKKTRAMIAEEKRNNETYH